MFESPAFRNKLSLGEIRDELKALDGAITRVAICRGSKLGRATTLCRAARSVELRSLHAPNGRFSLLATALFPVRSLTLAVAALTSSLF